MTAAKGDTAINATDLFRTSLSIIFFFLLAVNHIGSFCNRRVFAHSCSSTVYTQLEPDPAGGVREVLELPT